MKIYLAKLDSYQCRYNDKGVRTNVQEARSTILRVFANLKDATAYAMRFYNESTYENASLHIHYGKDSFDHFAITDSIIIGLGAPTEHREFSIIQMETTESLGKENVDLDFYESFAGDHPERTTTF